MPIVQRKIGTSTVQSVAKEAAPSAAVSVVVAQPVSQPTPAKAECGGRDFDKEARGKTRCAGIAAALASPAGQAFAATEKEYVEFIRRMADEVVRYTFQD